MGVPERGDGGGCSSFIFFSGWLIEGSLAHGGAEARGNLLIRGIQYKAVPETREADIACRRS